MSDSPKPFLMDELMALLPATLSDLKHESDLARRYPNNANIRRSLYKSVILALNDKSRFGHQEQVDGRMGLFIKGYVRDVWAYLEDAYDLIHNIDFERSHADLIRKHTEPGGCSYCEGTGIVKPGKWCNSTGKPCTHCDAGKKE